MSASAIYMYMYFHLLQKFMPHMIFLLCSRIAYRGVNTCTCRYHSNVKSVGGRFTQVGTHALYIYIYMYMYLVLYSTLVKKSGSNRFVVHA